MYRKVGERRRICSCRVGDEGGPGEEGGCEDGVEGNGEGWEEDGREGGEGVVV